MRNRASDDTVILAILALTIAVVTAIVILTLAGTDERTMIIIGGITAFVAPTILALLALLRAQDVRTDLNKAGDSIRERITEVEHKVENSNSGGNDHA